MRRSPSLDQRIGDNVSETETVFIVTVEHKHGTDSWAHRTFEGAIASLAEYCREWWAGEDDPPEDDEQCIKDYFENEQEFHTINESTLGD